MRLNACLWNFSELSVEYILLVTVASCGCQFRVKSIPRFLTVSAYKSKVLLIRIRGRGGY